MKGDVMPNARTHDAITLISGAALTPFAYSLLLGLRGDASVAALETALLVGAHLLSGMLFSPDLDIDSAIDNRWGVFFWIWRPYMWLVPHRHRWLSHGLVVSALLRLLYFYLVVVALLVGCTWLLGQAGLVFPTYHIALTNYLFSLTRDYPGATLAFIIGFVTGGAAHTIADWLVTGGKRYLRRIGIRVTRNYANHDRSFPNQRQRRARIY